MIRKVLFIALTVLMSGSVFAQESELNTPLGKFTSLKISGNMNVTLVKSDDYSMKVSMTDISPQKFEFSMKNEALSLKLKPVPDRSDYSVAVVLYYKELNNIAVDGATLVNEGVIDGKQLNIALSSGASVSLQLNADDINVHASGNAKITLAGEAEVFTAKAGMGGKINAVSLDCLYATVTANTGGECYVWATRRLEAKAATNANIYHKGTPEIIRISTSTLGNVMEIKGASSE